MLLIHVCCAPHCKIVRLCVAQLYAMQFLSYVTWSARFASARWLLLGLNVLTYVNTLGEGNSVSLLPCFYLGLFCTQLTQKIMIMYYINRNFSFIPFPSISILNKKKKTKQSEETKPCVVHSYLFHICLSIQLLMVGNEDK